MESRLNVRLHCSALLGTDYMQPSFAWESVRRWSVKWLLSQIIRGYNSPCNWQVFAEGNDWEPLYPEAILQQCLQDCRIVNVREMTRAQMRDRGEALEEDRQRTNTLRLPHFRIVQSERLRFGTRLTHDSRPTRPVYFAGLHTPEVSELLASVDQQADGLGSCSICLQDLIDSDEADALHIRQIKKCKHIFHTKCIEDWLKSATTCPLCRVVTRA